MTLMQIDPVKGRTWRIYAHGQAKDSFSVSVGFDLFREAPNLDMIGDKPRWVLRVDLLLFSVFVEFSQLYPVS